MPEMIVKTTTMVTDPGRRTVLEAGSVMSSLLSVGGGGLPARNDHGKCYSSMSLLWMLGHLDSRLVELRNDQIDPGEHQQSGDADPDVPKRDGRRT